MKIHRFIGDFSSKGEQGFVLNTEVEITNPQNIKQIKDVLRLEKGEKIILSDGAGTDAEVSINEISKNKIICIVNKINKTQENKEMTKNKRKVSLYLAILKKENFELAVQKAVECGVSNIIPVITERTIKTGLNIERLNKIILEACEQAGRSIVPTLSPILKFSGAIKDGNKNIEKVVFHFVNKIYKPDENATSVAIFVGPEGGFTEKEILEAKENNYKIASLGAFTLRGETAAIVATYRAVNNI